jgi:hypothetical protein
LSLLSFFIYTFIIPKLKYSLSFDTSFIFIIVLIFYIGIGLLFSISSSFDSNIYIKLILNYLIDIIIVSFL